MSEYDQLRKILDEHFLAPNQNQMKEEKGNTHTAQCINIDDGRRGIPLDLYRFDLDNQEFLPFFNKKHQTSPVGLRKFCDYILICEYNGYTYILLVELKRGRTIGADKQLNASETFIHYLFETAERLHKDFNDSKFERKNVLVRKIILEKKKSNKQNTHEYAVPDLTQEFLFYSKEKFYLIDFMKKK